VRKRIGVVALSLVRTGTPQQIQAAIDQGEDVNAHDKLLGWTALIYAAAYNPNPEVITVLLKAGADIKARNKDGETALMLAAQYNQNPEVITTLLRAGADLEARDSSFGWTPLMLAASSNPNPEVITTLLKAGADARVKDSAGKTAFDYGQDNENLQGTDAYWKLNQALY